MLVKLTADQIANMWDILKFGIENSLPPIAGEGPDKINKIFEALLSGGYDCWLGYEKDEENCKLKLGHMVVTTINKDNASDTNNFLIYTMYGFRPMSDDEWLGGYMTLAKYAKAKGCNRMIAYSNEPRVLDIVDKIGGDRSYSFISYSLNKNFG